MSAPIPPNPGSDEAVAAGCSCPVMDNNRGLVPPFAPDAWWITATCPLHGLDVPRWHES